MSNRLFFNVKKMANREENHSPFSFDILYYIEFDMYRCLRELGKNSLCRGYPEL